MRRLLLVIAALAVPGVGWCEGYKPDFNCASDHSKDSIATMLCQNSEAAKHELIFDQTYYALRSIVGKEGWKSLKVEAISDDEGLKDCIAPPLPDGTLPVADPACYITKMDAITGKYKQRLSGNALQEANRPIDQHIAIQQKLIDLGYLPTGTVADGVYGESTRQAISTWQRVTHQTDIDGFVSNSQASLLLNSTRAASAESVPTQQAGVIITSGRNPVPGLPTECHGDAKPITMIIGFEDPYEVTGKCYIIQIATRFGSKQWIDENTVLIIDSIPSGGESYSTIIHDPHGHVKYGSPAIVIGGNPIKYTAASGEMIIAPTLIVLKYGTEGGAE
ncbi:MULTISPECIES: peptidoglycan-binding protein [Acetobacter]|uniref:peptidoglycan-binding domain-containing protein n=1 Tax=Acetobacter TaxID=434 RepID=UPI00377034E2